MSTKFSVVVGLAAALCGGCGYTTERPFRSGIKTVHVEMLQSREFRRDLEFQLTEALIKRIEMDTPYKIAPLRTADTLFSGEILEVRERVFGDDFETGLPREKGATVIMRYRWKDLRTGEVLVDRDRFVHSVEYIPPVGETFAKGMVRGLDDMAEAIVETMESSW
ncbi:MAG: LPS assembly lipoprotein LptE [Planctomycetota bacterium]